MFYAHYPRNHSGVKSNTSTPNSKLKEVLYMNNAPRFSNTKMYEPKDIRSLILNSEIGKLNHFAESNNFKSCVLSIATGSKVDTSQAVRVMYEAIEKKSLPLYAILIELMSNTLHHAYGQESEEKNWHIISSKSTNSVKFYFLDTGAGIPDSVSRKTRGALNDSAAITFALKGHYRECTKSLMPGRGLGLPGIFHYFNNNTIKNLQVLSGYGYCDFASNKEIDMFDYFNGTLLSWELSAKEA